MSETGGRSVVPAGWRIARFGEVLERAIAPVQPKANDLYREIGIRSHGKGIFHKEPVKGSVLGAKRVFVVVPGCLTVNIVFAWEGAVAVTSDSEMGMIASHRFPMYRPRAPAQVDVEFLRRFFQTKHGVKLLGEASPGGAGRNRTLNQSFLDALPVPLPPLPEQQKIAAILSSVDEAIEATGAVIAQLQAVKNAMMADLLTKGLPRRHTEFKQTDAGVIPAAWKVTTVGRLGTWLSGGTPSKANHAFWSGIIPWVSPKDMKVARLADAIDHVSEDAIEHGTQLAPENSILVVVRGMILAHSFPVALTTRPVAFNQDIKALVPASGFLPEFVLYWLTSRKDEVLAAVDIANHGTKRLPTERFFAMSVPEPPLAEQQELNDVLRAFDERIERDKAVAQQLRMVRASLLPALLTGELRVRPDGANEVAA